MDQSVGLSRRSLLGAVTATTLGLPTLASALTTGRSSLKIAFMTDTHIRTADNCPAWLEVAAKSIAATKPDVVIHGGDLFDIAERQTIEEIKALLPMWKRVTDIINRPILYTLGNHDLAHMNGDPVTSGSLRGKGLHSSLFSSGKTYYSREVGGVQFIVLDAIGLKDDKGGYRGFIDPDQMKWLEATLLTIGKQKPILFSVHIPVFSAVPQYDIGSDKPLPDWQMVLNGKDLFKLIQPYNVMGVMQGHTHVVEEVKYNKTHWITGGAVCGGWWKGNRLDIHAPGFTTLQVKGDSLTWDYVPYGWKAS